MSNVGLAWSRASNRGQAINILVIFLLTMALLTALVGSIRTTGTMGMNVLERNARDRRLARYQRVDFESSNRWWSGRDDPALIERAAAVVLSFPISFDAAHHRPGDDQDRHAAGHHPHRHADLQLGVVIVLSVVAEYTARPQRIPPDHPRVLAYE